MPISKAPVFTSVTCSSKTNTSFTIKATANDNEGDKIIYRLYVGNRTLKATSEQVNSGTTVTLKATGLSENTTYNYYVTATDVNGAVGTSSKYYVVVDNSAPGVPTVSFSSKTTNSFKVNAVATDVDGDNLVYNLYAKTPSESTYSLKDTSASTASGTQVSLTASGLSQYTDYDYYVTVTDGSETSTSSTDSVKTYCSGTCSTWTTKYRDIDCEDCDGSGDCLANYERDYNLRSTYEGMCSHNHDYIEEYYWARCSEHLTNIGKYKSFKWVELYYSQSCSTCSELSEYQSGYIIDSPCDRGCETCQGTGVSGQQKYYYCGKHGDLGISYSHKGCLHGHTSQHD